MNFEGKQQSLLTFRIGPVLCCAPSLPVQSIITPPKLTHPPGSDSSQPGIFKHGKHIVKVIDLRQKFGVELSAQTQPGNLIITVFEKENFAFWVDQILDVFDFPTTGWGNLPAAIPRGVFTRTLLLNKKIHLYSEFENLASINDLGYLKHYIQQLTENQNKEEKKHEQHVQEPDIKGSNIQAPAIKDINIEKQKIKEHKIKEKKIQDKPVVLETKKEPVITRNIFQEKPTAIKSNLSSEINKPAIKQSNAFVNSNATSKPLEDNTAHDLKPYSAKVSPTSINNTPAAEPIIDRNKTSKPATASAHNFKSINEKEKRKHDVKQIPEEESSSFGLVIFFILILLSLAGGAYFLFSSMNTGYEKKIIKPAVIQPKVESTFDEEHATEFDDAQGTYSIEPELKPAPEISINEKEDEPVENIDKNVDIAYRADITQQDNDITITLHQPVEVTENNLVEITPQQPAEPIIVEKPLASADVKTLKIEELKEDIKAEKIVNEIVHIVVKGDTLWAIAKKYVNNPFLYPELARLSNIKNPHRIYPGNRVRIRFISQ